MSEPYRWPDMGEPGEGHLTVHQWLQGDPAPTFRGRFPTADQNQQLPGPRVRLFDEDWNVLANTTLDGRTAVTDWLRANARVGNGVSVDHHGNRRIGTVQPGGTIRDWSEELRAVEWPTSPFWNKHE